MIDESIGCRVVVSGDLVSFLFLLVLRSISFRSQLGLS